MLTLAPLMAVAQSFNGGAGDGHAMTQLVLRETGVQELQSAVSVYPNLLQAGQAIYVKHTLPGAVVASLISMDGVAIASMLVAEKGRISTQAIPAGLYLLQLQYAGSRYTHKITVVE